MHTIKQPLKMKNIAIFLVLSLALLACEKRKINRTENKLEGSWKLIKSEYGESENDISDREQIITFYDNAEDYSVVNGLHHGSMLFKYTDFSYELQFFYSAINKGDDLLLMLEYNSPGYTSALNNTAFELSDPSIKKLTKKKFIMEGKNADGITSTFTFERIKE